MELDLNWVESGAGAWSEEGVFCLKYFGGGLGMWIWAELRASGWICGHTILDNEK